MLQRSLASVICLLLTTPLAADPSVWQREWPNTDFARHDVDYGEIISGGPPKDGIPSIDDPRFVPVAEADLPANEPVIGLVIDGDARAYPLRILIWHEIVNDVVGGVPVAVTFCPLCNTGIVFDRRLDGEVLEFGTTGKLRKSDLVMYDRTTESWWQQFLGEAIVGELTGKRLAMLPAHEPVIGLVIEGDARAYPLRILIWHEIVNDVVGGVPVAVTFCPLCNTGIVFDRRQGGLVLEFGTTGKLRNSDLVMYDRATESWWQQFVGEAIVGELTGSRLAMLPSRLESFANFVERAPDGRVQVASAGALRGYGRNPYVGYDTSPAPFLYRGPLPEQIAPLARVIRVDDEAWALDLLRAKGAITTADGLKITWQPGQVSALDRGTIAESFDVGNVLVQRRTAAGWEDAVYSVDFAFAFRAFYPNGTIHLK